MSEGGNNAAAASMRDAAQQPGVPPAAGEGAQTQSAASQAPGILDGVMAAYGSARQSISDFLELIALEVRHAGLTLMWMMAWGVIAAVLVIAGWIGFMAALALWVVSLGLPWIAVIICIAFANVLAAALIFSSCMKM